MKTGKKRNINLTEGPIAKSILLFALPLLGSSLVQQLYHTVDLLYVGRSLGKNASAAIGASSMMVTCLIGFFGGLAVGAGVMIARYYGAKDARMVRRSMETTLSLAAISSALIMILGIAGAPLFLRLLSTPVEIRADATAYLRIYFLSSFFIVFYNMGSGAIRAMGESFSPLMYQLAGGIVNVIADGIFVFGLHLGVRGVAWATLFSQGMAAFLTLRYLYRLTPPEIRPDPRRCAPDGGITKEILRIGIPAGCQTLVIALSNVIAQYFINSLGTVAIAAFTAYLKVELPIYLPMVAIGHAVMTFFSQNLGAGQMERAQKGTRVCLGICVLLTIVSSVTILLLGHGAFSLFSREEAVIRTGVRIISVSFPFYTLYCVLQVYGDALRGAGESRAPMWIILANICVLRSVVMAVLMPHWPDVRTIAASYPITWFFTALEMALYYRFGGWMKAVLIPKAAPEPD